MAKLKIAIVGVGSISNFHIKAYQRNPDVELYAFCDINADRLEMMGKKYDITRLYTDEKTMLEELPELDAVSVCTWNSAHASCSILALNAGKHVLCEKPMAMNVEEAMEMQSAAQKSGKLLMIGFVRRFGKDCQTVTNLMNADILGEIYYAKAMNLRRNGNPGGWFSDKKRSGGGPLIDLGVHSIDLVRYLMGKPKAVSVFGATFLKLGARSNIRTSKAYTSAGAESADICDCEDLATAMIRFDNGSALTVEMSFSLNVGKEENSVQLFGTRGGVKMAEDVTVYSELGGYLTDLIIDGQTGFDFEQSFCREISHFTDCILNGTDCVNPAEDGIEMMKILSAIYRSAEEGHEVIL